MHLVAGKRVKREGWNKLAQYKFACTGEWGDWVNAYKSKLASGSHREVECFTCLGILKVRKKKELEEIEQQLAEVSQKLCE